MLNILAVEAGGKGIMLVSNIICDAAIKSNLDIRHYNRVGLVQRNGEEYANIRIGKSSESAEIPIGCGDIMLGLEPLEAYRRSNVMKKNGTIILNNYKIYPSYSLYYENTYPKDIKEKLEEEYDVIPVNSEKIYNKLVAKGCMENYRIKINNEFIPRKILDVYMYMVGILGKLLKSLIPYDNWILSIEKNVTSCILNEAKCAFNMGYSSIY